MATYYEILQKELKKPRPAYMAQLSTDAVSLRIVELSEILRGPLKDYERIPAYIEQRNLRDELASRVTAAA